MHLNAEQFVDIADGTRPESSAPHLTVCEPCRAQLCELRAMMAAAKDVNVPEPSPLFWDHLSSRVSEAVAAEAGDARLKRSRSLLNGSRFFGDVLAALGGARSVYGARAVFGARAFQASVAIAAALLIAVALRSRAPSPVPAVVLPAVSVADAGAVLELLSDVGPDNDASLTLVASLTDDVDMDTAREAGLAPRGSAEHAVTHMSDGELRELRRLLNEELARSGA